MHILITGVGGFIGSNLAPALLDRGHRVTGIDNFSQGLRSNLDAFGSHSAFRLIEGDIRSQEFLQSASADVDCFVHLAAFKIPRYGNTLDTLEINSVGTQNILDVASRGKRRVVAASTSDVYGCNPNLPFQETNDLWIGPSSVRRWAYAVSKLYDEHLAFAYQETHGVPVVLVRFFGGYGPGQNTTWWGGPQSVFIDAALRNRPMEIHGDGQQTRSFTYVSDHVAGLVGCIEREEACGQVFNLGNTEEITILDLAQLVWRMVRDDEPKYELISYTTFGKYQDVRRRVPDVSKATRLLGVTPKVGLQEGLAKTIAWQRAVSEEVVNNE